jgi:hypothetical protein
LDVDLVQVDLTGYYRAAMGAHRSILVKLLLLLGLILPFMKAVAADWPNGLVLHEDSTSPDGHYGILVATSSHVDDGKTYLIAEEGEDFTNYLADLRTHRTLGKIKKADYVEHENHRHLDVAWSPDSKVCILTYWDRYGFSSIAVLEPRDASFTQASLGERIQKSLDSELRKQSHDSDMTADGYPYCRLEPDRKVRVFAEGRNNPKSLEEAKTYYALFQGTFDLVSRKWTTANARPISVKQDEMMDRAREDCSMETFIVSPEAFKDLTPDAEEPLLSDGKNLFRSEETRAKYFDDRLNDVYQTAQLLLPPARFAKVKQEQIEWLKKRDAATLPTEKSQLIAERVKALQDLLW